MLVVLFRITINQCTLSFIALAAAGYASTRWVAKHCCCWLVWPFTALYCPNHRMGKWFLYSSLVVHNIVHSIRIRVVLELASVLLSVFPPRTCYRSSTRSVGTTMYRLRTYTYSTLCWNIFGLFRCRGYSYLKIMHMCMSIMCVFLL